MKNIRKQRIIPSFVLFFWFPVMFWFNVVSNVNSSFDG